MASGNDVLTALPPDELRKLRNWLQPVKLGCKNVVLRAGQAIDAVWFPETCVVSLVIQLPEGRDVECGMIGHEGVVGLGGAMTSGYAYTHQAVQIGGSAQKLEKAILLQRMRDLPTFAHTLLKCHDAFVSYCLQMTACFAIHSSPERLARILLELSDRARSDELFLTHDVLALAIGGSRQRVTTILGQLESLGALRTFRNRIVLCDKRLISVRACSCYRIEHSQPPRMSARSDFARRHP